MSTVHIYAITNYGRQKLPHTKVDDAMAWAHEKNAASQHGYKVTKIVREVKTEHFV